MVGRPNLRTKKDRHALEKFEGESSVWTKLVGKRSLRSAISRKRHSPVKKREKSEN